MEFKFGQYVWWDAKQIETIKGTITRIEPQTKDGEQKTTKDGRKKYNLVLEASQTGVPDEVKISIVETQRNFFDYQIGKYGAITHNPANNHLTFEECEEILSGLWGTTSEDSSRKQYAVEPEKSMEQSNEREHYFEKMKPHMLRGWLERKIERMENDLEWYKQILEALP